MSTHRTILATILATMLLAGCGGDGGDEDRADADAVGRSESEDTIDLPVLDDPAETMMAHIEEVGLDICSDDETGANILGSYGGRSWAVGAPCDEDPLKWDGYVSISLFNDPATAAEQFQTPPPGVLITWMLDPTTVATVPEASDPRVVTAMTQVLGDYPSAGPGA